MIQELLGGGKDINIFSSITFASSSAKTCPTPTTQVDSKTTLPANTSNSTSVANNAKNNDRNNNSEMNNQKLRCPRCESTNTKFCYYNNYNLTQPRHFCKTCRRYWTKGGTLRNVPIGGGCRKNKIISSSTTSYPSSSSLSISPFTNSSLAAIFHSAKCPLSTKLLFPDLIGKVVLDPQSDISNPTFWPPQPSHNSHTRAFLNANANPTQGLFDPYSANGAPTLLGSSSFLRSHQHQVLNGLASQDNRNIMELYQKLKPPRGYENPGQLISENVIGSSSLSPSPSSSSPIYIGSTALREGGSGENLGIPSWPAQFSTLPMNGAYYP